MLLLLGVLIVLFAAVYAAKRRPGLRGFGVAAMAGLVTIASWMVWSVFLYLGIVRVDPLIRYFGAYRLEQPWAALLFLGPPLLVGVVFAAIAARRSNRS